MALGEAHLPLMISERRWDETGEEHFRETVRPSVWESRARQCVCLPSAYCIESLSRFRYRAGKKRSIPWAGVRGMSPRSPLDACRTRGMLVELKATRRSDKLGHVVK